MKRWYNCTTIFGNILSSGHCTAKWFVDVVSSLTLNKPTECNAFHNLNRFSKCRRQIRLELFLYYSWDLNRVKYAGKYLWMHGCNYDILVLFCLCIVSIGVARYLLLGGVQTRELTVGRRKLQGLNCGLSSKQSLEILKTFLNYGSWLSLMNRYLEHVSLSK